MQDKIPGDDTPGAGGAAPTPPPTPTPPPPPASPTPPATGSNSIADRAKAILFQPETEWPRIDAEATSVGRIFMPYVLVLAAIPPISFLLGLLIAGAPLSWFWKLVVVFYLILLGITFVLSLAIDGLAPSFGGTRSHVQAMKLAAYSSTPLFVAGVLLILSTQGGELFMWLWLIAGIGYGGYLLYLGVPRLMRVTAEKAPGFVAVVVGLWVVLLLIGEKVAWFLMRQLEGGYY